MSRRRHPDSQSPQDGQGPDGHGDEFTRVVRRKLATSTRTGQACDRCKVRKIRCDGLPGGCSPCIQNRNECKTTDRISQKAVPRGHLENLERQVNELKARNQELQAQLAMQMEQANGGYGLQEWTNNGIPSQRADPGIERWRPNNRSPYPSLAGGSGGQSASAKPRPFNFVPGTSSTHYLGMSAGASYLNAMKQQALKLLGLDVALDSQHDETATPDVSGGSALRSIFNIGPSPKAQLPPREEGMRYVEFYFRVSHPYLPILHKPTFMTIVDRVYSDTTYQPTAAQTVSLHMVLAIVHWQTAANIRLRNGGHDNDETNDLFARSKNHYLYALSHFYELNSSCSVEDLQALGLILQHMRAFPKPGRSWLMARSAMAMCIELGLHRKSSNWRPDGPEPNCIEIEMRKRIFWCILTLEVSLAGKLGRPMSLREGDWDVDYPERVEDESITETGILNTSVPDECSIDVAIAMFKHTAITMKIHSTLYGAIRPSIDKYVSLVEDLERDLSTWREKCDYLSLDSPNPVRRFHAAHLLSWYHESRILLRHPSLRLAPSPSFTNECTRICVESSRAIISLTDSLRKGNHYLDTTWYGATVQLVAILTILFSVWEKRETVKSDEIEQMKKDMEVCQDIMADLDNLLGAPNQLRTVVRLLTQGTMKLLFPRPEQRQRLSMQADSRSTPSVPTFASVQNGFPPAASTSPLVNHSGSATEQIPRSSAPFQEPTTMALIDPLVANSDNTSFSGASNTTFPFQTSQPGGFHPDPSHGSTVFPWSGAWGSNSNWNKFSQDLSFVATDLTPPGLSQEVYDGVTGLAALQAQNTFLQTGNSGNSGPVPTSGLGMVAPNVQTHGQHASASPSPSPYTTGIHQSPQWPTGQNYSFSDNGLRNVPNEQ